MLESATAMSLVEFEEYVSSLVPGLKRQYDRGVNRDLSQQRWQGLLKRNITTVLQQFYQDVLLQLQQLVLDHDGMGGETGEGGRERILQSCQHLIDELMQYALQKHRSSCALSNFPEEHNPSQAYITQVLQEVDRDWSVFASRLADMLPG